MKPPIDLNKDWCSECKYIKMPHYQCTHFMYRWMLSHLIDEYTRKCPLFEKKEEKENETTDI